MGFAPLLRSTALSFPRLLGSPECPPGSLLSATQLGGFWSTGMFLLSPFCIPWGMRAAPSRHPNPSPAAPTSRGTEHITRLFYLVSCASLPSTAVVGGGFDRVPKLLPASRQAGLFATSKGGGDLHHHTPGDEQHPGLQHHRTEGCGIAACTTTTARHVVGCPIGLVSTACRGSSVTLNPA